MHHFGSHGFNRNWSLLRPNIRSVRSKQEDINFYGKRTCQHGILVLIPTFWLNSDEERRKRGDYQQSTELGGLHKCKASKHDSIRNGGIAHIHMHIA